MWIKIIPPLNSKSSLTNLFKFLKNASPKKKTRVKLSVHTFSSLCSIKKNIEVNIIVGEKKLAREETLFKYVEQFCCEKIYSCLVVVTRENVMSREAFVYVGVICHRIFDNTT